MKLEKLSTGELIIKLTSVDVDECIEAYDEYMNMKGEVFEKEWLQYPCTSHFCAIYFLNSTEDDYHLPDSFVCRTQKSADKLKNILKKLEFVSKIDGTTCEIVQKDCILDVVFTYAE